MLTVSYRCSIIVGEETLIVLSVTNRKQENDLSKIVHVPNRTLNGASK